MSEKPLLALIEDAKRDLESAEITHIQFESTISHIRYYQALERLEALTEFLESIVVDIRDSEEEAPRTNRKRGTTRRKKAG